ncbi:MAG TPA: response regulator [Humisphaera sp.]|jgi:FixJ family two-component response regulator|nr:response regulator [Humisphaera sp.]
MNDPTNNVVYVVDDDPPVLKAVARVLRSAGYQAVTFSSSQRFLDQHDTAVPCCVVLDLAMPGISGLELQMKLAAARTEMPIIFLTGQGDVPTSVKAMKQGAADFLTKPVEREALLGAVRVALGKDHARRIAQQEMAETLRRLSSLTSREYEVFEHVIKGDLNKQTAAELGAAEKTIKVHRSRVMDKMQVRSVAALVRMAERAGIAVPAEEQQRVRHSF